MVTTTDADLSPARASLDRVLATLRRDVALAVDRLDAATDLHDLLVDAERAHGPLADRDELVALHARDPIMTARLTTLTERLRKESS